MKSTIKNTGGLAFPRAMTEDIAWPNDEVMQFAEELSRAIAQAVLQLPEIQALRKDARRYRYLKKGNQWIVASTQTGFHVDGEELDDLIDSEMEDQE